MTAPTGFTASLSLHVMKPLLLNRNIIVEEMQNICTQMSSWKSDQIKDCFDHSLFPLILSRDRVTIDEGLDWRIDLLTPNVS
jgi:hypothetical protein